MKQDVMVIALVRRKDKILLLKRASDQGDLAGKYELPGGALEHGEQPEESLLRHLKEATQLSASTPYLSDVFTYVDGAEGNEQRTVVAYEIVSFDGRVSIQLDQTYSRYSWENPDELDPEDLAGQSRILLDTYTAKISRKFGKSEDASDSPALVGEKGGAIIYSDGGSRGNPGPSAAGYIILDADSRLLYEGGTYLGITTNNLAEYHGVYLGLEKAKSMGVKSIEFRVDSMLVVNQLNGIYSIRNRELWPIHERIRELLDGFDRVVFRHVKREFNQQADSMVNKILDTRTGKS